MLADFQMNFTIDEITFVMYLVKMKKKNEIILEIHDPIDKIVIQSSYYIQKILKGISNSFKLHKNYTIDKIDIMSSEHYSIHICMNIKQLVLSREYTQSYLKYIKKMLSVIEQ